MRRIVSAATADATADPEHLAQCPHRRRTARPVRHACGMAIVPQP
jgi:hypothetical protein